MSRTRSNFNSHSSKKTPRAINLTVKIDAETMRALG
jgi:hypothetical protein